MKEDDRACKGENYESVPNTSMSANFFSRGPDIIVKSLSFAGHMVFVSITQICCSAKAVIDTILSE